MNNQTPQYKSEVEPGFETVKEIFEQHLKDGWDVGASFTAYLDGKRVVHLVGGYRDTKKTQAFNDETLQLIASSSKFAESLCIAMLVDRGQLSYDQKISKFWPEFGQKGKEHITIRQLMMHRAGLPALDHKLKDDEIFNLDKRSEVLSSQELFWTPPDESSNSTVMNEAQDQAYHGITRGLIASELCRRVDPQKRSLSQFLQDEVCKPLGIEFYIGLPENLESRVSDIFKGPPPVMMSLLGLSPDTSVIPANDPRYQLFDYEKSFLKEFILDRSSLAHRSLNLLEFEGVAPEKLGECRQIRACELPSSNGMANSDAIAKMAHVLANGGSFQGNNFLSSSTIDQTIKTASDYSTDKIMKTIVKFTQGGFAQLEAQDELKTKLYGWGGSGGSMARFHPGLRFSCAYVTNTLGFKMAMNDPRPNRLLAGTLDCARKAGKFPVLKL